MVSLRGYQLKIINYRLQGYKNVSIEEKGYTNLDKIVELSYQTDEEHIYLYKNVVAKASKLACEIYASKVFDKKCYETAIISALLLITINGYQFIDNTFIEIEDIKGLIIKNDVHGVYYWLIKHIKSNINTIDPIPD